jgi:hypothetical protein
MNHESIQSSDDSVATEIVASAAHINLELFALTDEMRELHYIVGDPTGSYPHFLGAIRKALAERAE